MSGWDHLAQVYGSPQPSTPCSAFRGVSPSNNFTKIKIQLKCVTGAMLSYSWDPSQLHWRWPGGRYNQPSNLQEMSELLNIKPKCDSGIYDSPMGKKDPGRVQ